MMDIQLSEHFTYKKLLMFSLPPISAMIFTSIYGIVDGYFVSNYVGSTPFASLNLVMPFIMLIGGIGFMFGTGGSALVALHMGMKEDDKANRYFSLIVYTTMAAGFILGTAGFILSPFAVKVLGATPQMVPYCILYLRISMVGIPFFMIQELFQTFLITAEKPKLGFRITVTCGCINIFLDWLLVGYLKWGLAGAAFATIFSEMIGAIIPIILFATNKNWNLHLGKTSLELKVILKACGNGISEFLSSISASIVGFVYNFQLLRYAGENGVSAYGVIMYVSLIFAAIYIGYTMGVSPIISYHDGARNTDELKSLYSKSLRIIFLTNIMMFVLAELSSGFLSNIFVGYDLELYTLTVRGLRIFSVAFLLMGFNIFGSAFFTALNNGKISAILSVSRTLIIELIMVILLPMVLGIDGIWCVVIAVESVGNLLTAFYLMKNGRKYGYRGDK